MTNELSRIFSSNAPMITYSIPMMTTEYQSFPSVIRPIAIRPIIIPLKSNQAPSKDNINLKNSGSSEQKSMENVVTSQKSTGCMKKINSSEKLEQIENSSESHFEMDLSIESEYEKKSIQQKENKSKQYENEKESCQGLWSKIEHTKFLEAADKYGNN